MNALPQRQKPKSAGKGPASPAQCQQCHSVTLRAVQGKITARYLPRDGKVRAGEWPSSIEKT